MKYTFLILVLFGLFNFNEIANRENTKFSATISHEYITWQSPVTINYKVHTYGGSGNFEYRWRIKGTSFENFSSQDHFQQIFNCEKSKRPESSVYLQIRDIETEKVHLIKTTHPVEICLTNNKKS